MKHDTYPAPSRCQLLRTSSTSSQLRMAQLRVPLGKSAKNGTRHIWGKYASHARGRRFKSRTAHHEFRRRRRKCPRIQR